MDVHKLLSSRAAQYADKPALIFKEHAVSFAHLKNQVLRLANALQNQGVGRGDKVAIYLPNRTEYAVSYLACFCLGAVVVPLDYLLKNDELLSCLEHSETKALIAQVKPDIDFQHLSASLLSLEKMIFLAPATAEIPSFALSYDELLASAPSDEISLSINESDPALIMYTSGTTGRPKGIVLNYKHLDGSPEALRYFVDLSDRHTKLCTIPLSHIAGFMYVQNCLIFAITVVLMDRFHPLEFLKNIERYQVTCFHIVPAMYTALLSLKQIEKFNLSSLRWVVVFGAPSTPEILERFHRYCINAKLLNGWGMTETCPPNTVTPMGSSNIASVGKPAPHCKITIVDEEDQDVAQGEIGEIRINGWNVMAGYYKDPEATAAAMRNGWLYTGDLGKIDNEGFLYIVGRKKEMIKVAGQIVFAPEVESALNRHEDVQESAVIGVRDPLRGEVVKAFVVLKEGVTSSAKDLRYYAREHLANYKVPQSIEIRDELPKNRTGKIDKNLLKQETMAQSPASHRGTGNALTERNDG